MSSLEQRVARLEADPCFKAKQEPPVNEKLHQWFSELTGLEFEFIGAFLEELESGGWSSLPEKFPQLEGYESPDKSEFGLLNCLVEAFDKYCSTGELDLFNFEWNRHNFEIKLPWQKIFELLPRWRKDEPRTENQ